MAWAVSFSALMKLEFAVQSARNLILGNYEVQFGTSLM